MVLSIINNRTVLQQERSVLPMDGNQLQKWQKMIFWLQSCNIHLSYTLSFDTEVKEHKEQE